MKKLIRLTESDLHRIVKESVNRVLREAKTIDMYTGDEFDENNLFHPEWGDEEWEKYAEETNNEIDDYLSGLSEEEILKLDNALKKAMSKLGIQIT